MIRKIKIEDLVDVLQLLKQLWPDASIIPEDMEVLFKQFLKDDCYDMYCYEDEKILGIITISERHTFFYGGKVAVIEDLVVEGQNRGRGIGRKLVEFVEKELDKEGIKAIELSSDLHRSEAHRFWEKLGYGSSAYQFRKTLSDR